MKTIASMKPTKKQPAKNGRTASKNKRPLTENPYQPDSIDAEKWYGSYHRETGDRTKRMNKGTKK